MINWLKNAENQIFKNGQDVWIGTWQKEYSKDQMWNRSLVIEGIKVAVLEQTSSSQAADIKDKNQSLGDWGERRPSHTGSGRGKDTMRTNILQLC